MTVDIADDEKLKSTCTSASCIITITSVLVRKAQLKLIEACKGINSRRLMRYAEAVGSSYRA